MKPSRLILLFVAAAVTAHAQGRAKLPRNARTARLFDLSELATQREKFEVFRKGSLLGGDYYAQPNTRLAKRHAEIYRAIEKATSEGRLEDAQASGFVDELIAIGEKAKAARGDATEMDAEASKATAAALDELAKRAQAAASAVAGQEKLTPQLQDSQWTMGELLRFGRAGAMPKTDLAGIERRLQDLAQKEDKAQKDGEIDDREREELHEEARQTWKKIADALD
jgi:hypothetical protein